MEGGKQSEDLMEVSVPIVENQQCQVKYISTNIHLPFPIIRDRKNYTLSRIFKHFHNIFLGVV